MDIRGSQSANKILPRQPDTQAQTLRAGLQLNNFSGFSRTKAGRGLQQLISQLLSQLNKIPPGEIQPVYGSVVADPILEQPQPVYGAIVDNSNNTVQPVYGAIVDGSDTVQPVYGSVIVDGSDNAQPIGTLVEGSGNDGLPPLYEVTADDANQSVAAS
ncbi:MAG: hypothetical protein HZT40_13265 [Candidatus Thiothrix singaporensis]|uniref:Uncharacterized protein n=1 Tax=Candidatus Thiothrix singaporensis TaxID=2799669 RepID=A0A7L6ATF9_9GAMM|nr:MAG: hypothetical protein HZT40_13265 [Candidatus Thiothrix singaporensis]